MAWEAKFTNIMNKGSEDAKYIVLLKHMGKCIVCLDEKLALINFEEEMYNRI